MVKNPESHYTVTNMSPSQTNKIALKIDFREKRCGIVGELEKLPHPFDIEIINLPVGDYIIGEKVIIERKTVTDFINSVKNGRIFNQAYRMAGTEYSCLIILEGKNPSPNETKIKRNAIQGVMLHLAVILHIPVVRSKDICETAWLINRIAFQLFEVPFKQNKLNNRQNLAYHFRRKKKQKLQLLQNIPGIGTEKALALLRTYGSLQNIFNKNTNELAEVRGIGKKLATNIYNILHEPF